MYARLTESRNAKSKKLLMVPTGANRQRMATRRALEWIRTFESLAGF